MKIIRRIRNSSNRINLAASVSLAISSLLISSCDVLAQKQLVPKSDTDASKAPIESSRVWAGLVWAHSNPSNTEVEAENDQDFENIKPNLKIAFKDYSHFNLLGMHKLSVYKAFESWAVLSKDKKLDLRFDSKGMDSHGGLNLHIQLWQEHRVLVKADAMLRKDSPLFIAGPQWRNGRLLFVIIVDNSH